MQRRPAVILVDELAHSNHPGARHPKRWMDIEELLGAGIDVYTTVNVQHLESLNDVVAQITGVQVRETVPDKVFDSADEVELVDLPPDDLLQRLQEGKVYVEQKARHALEAFFRKGNLIALRQLALRATADRVDTSMREYRDRHAISDTWPAGERVLVCVGPDPLSARLVRSARRLATALHAEWLAVYVETPALVRLSRQARDRVLQTLKLAESLGADTENLSGESVAVDSAGLRTPAQRQQDHRRQTRTRTLARSVPAVAGRRDRARQRRHRRLRHQRRTGRGKRRAATLAETFEQTFGVPARRHRGRRRNAGMCCAQPSSRAHQPGHAVSARYGAGRDPFRARAVGRWRPCSA